MYYVLCTSSINLNKYFYSFFYFQGTPHELWSTLAQRRNSILKWFLKCNNNSSKDKIDYVLSGIMSNSLGDPSARWSTNRNQNYQTKSGVFTHPNGTMRLDTTFCELNFLTGTMGTMVMPDNLGSNVDLQEILLSARGGVESPIMPHVVARQLRRYMQSYYLPAVTSGDEGLELKYWTGVPLEDNTIDGAYVRVMNFPTGYNGKYVATRKKSCQEPVYKKGDLILRKTKANGDNNPDAQGDRYHIEQRGRCVAWSPDELIIGKESSNSPSSNKTKWSILKGGEWSVIPNATTILHQAIVEVSFGSFIKKPAHFNFDGTLGIHNGSMADLSEDDGWIVFNVYHSRGGLHDLYIRYTAQDSRPCKLRINGDRIYENVASQTTGSWGRNTLKTFKENHAGPIDLGEPNSYTKVEIRANEYCPHLNKMRFDPVDGRRDIIGMPVPQNYTGNKNKTHKASILDDGNSFESSSIEDKTVIQFRNRKYGGENRICRMSIFSIENLNDLCTKDSIIPATAEYIGGRYRETQAWGNPLEKAPPTSSRKWRITAPNGTGSKRWNVTKLQFLDKKGQPIQTQSKGRAICCGSILDTMGPENALNCLPEIRKGDSGESISANSNDDHGGETKNNAPITVKCFEGQNNWIGTWDTSTDQYNYNTRISKNMYIGVDFNESVEVGGFQIIQGKNYTSLSLNELKELYSNTSGDDDEIMNKKSKYGNSDFAERISLQVLDEREGIELSKWRTIQTFTMRESRSKNEVTRLIGQSAGGNKSTISSGKANESLLGVMAANPNEQWVAELLIRCVKETVKLSLTNDNVMMIFPHVIRKNATTILLCDPSKPSVSRWSLMMLDRCHHVINVYGLREHGRRCFTEHLWTSNYSLSKHEIVPKISFFDAYQPHPWCNKIAGHLFDHPAVGGWVRGMSPRPSVVIQRKVNGNSEMLIPSRYLGGILPNCLTENFRFWRDEQLHAVIAERKLDADETWFGYELEIMVKASLNSSLSSEAKSNGGGNMFQKGLLRTKSKVRVSNSNIKKINMKIKDLKSKLKALQKNTKSNNSRSAITNKMNITKEINELLRKRTALQRDTESNDGGQILMNNQNESFDVHFDVWRSKPDPADPGIMCRHRLVDFTSADVRPNTWLSNVCRLFERIENASNILLWAAVDHPKSKSKKLIALHEVVEIIELPRLRLRFETTFNNEGKLRILSSEHTGKFLLTIHESGTEEEQNDLRKVAGISPFTLLLGDEEGNRFVMVPSCPYQPRFLWSNYWQNRIIPIRNDKKWLSTFEVRVYVYKIHESRLFCEMPSLGAALLWSYLQMADRRYVQAAQTIDCMSSDEHFTKEEKFQLTQYLRLFSFEQLVTDALIGLCVKMFLKFKDSPEAQSWPLPCDPTKLIPISAHIPSACRISHEEELRLYRMGYGTDLRKNYIIQANQGGNQLLKVKNSNVPASANGESFKYFALGKHKGSAWSILKDAMLKIKEADEKYENVDGWVRLDNTFLHDFRGRDGTKDEFIDCYDTLKEAKIQFIKLQKHKNERERPVGITYYRSQYGFRFSIRTDRSGSNETSWYKIFTDGGIDKRGNRASLWNTKSIKYTPPKSKKLTGRPLLGSGQYLEEFLHDELDGSSNGLGFLFACQVMGECKYTLSVDGSQDNTQSIMSQAIHVVYNDRGLTGNMFLDNSVSFFYFNFYFFHSSFDINY